MSAQSRFIPPIAPIAITAWTAASSLGDGRAAMLAALQEDRSGLQPNDFTHQPLPTWIGRHRELEDTRLPAALVPWDCRNHRLAWRGLQADGFIDAVASARDRLGAARIAVVMGTSTSSIGATEDAYRALDADGRFPADQRRPRVHTLHSIAAFVQQALALAGPCLTVSTACSSSAKAFATAERLLRLGLVDAAVVGGADTLCGSVLFGFNALQLVSSRPCRPFDEARDGINLGEAAGFALLERGPAELMLTGYGESSDAHHMSAPDPSGSGAEHALDDALSRAGLDTTQIDHIALHGTASAQNDAAEAALVARRFGDGVHASSTKGLTGHTLGAAGIVNAAFALTALTTGWMAGTVGAERLDSGCGPQIRLRPARAEVRRVLSHSFGFGGTNCVLAFERAA